MNSSFPYLKLPGGERGFVRRSSLWEGADHLLLVRGTRFSEEYRRFYYRDIQALLMERCGRSGSIGWWLLHVFATLIAILAGFARGTMPRTAIWIVVALLVAGLVLRLVIALRHSCRCVVQTAVSREELPPLQRTWNADRAFKRIREKIVAAQGELPDDIAPLLHEAHAVSSAATAQPAADTSAEAQDKVERRAARAVNLAACLFALMLVGAAQSFRFLDGPTAARNSPLFQALNAALVLITGTVTVFSLLNAQGLRNQSNLRKLLIVSLLLQGLDIYFSTIMGALYTMRSQTVVINLPSLKAWRWMVGFDITAFILVGGGGLAFLLLNWEFLRRGDTSRV